MEKCLKNDGKGTRILALRQVWFLTMASSEFCFNKARFLADFGGQQ